MISVRPVIKNGKKEYEVQLEAKDSALLYYEVLSVIRSVFERTGYDKDVLADLHSLVDQF